MPFTPIEEQHYQELFSQMCEELGVDTQGNPLTSMQPLWSPIRDSINVHLETFF
jgi:hypothetical protein